MTPDDLDRISRHYRDLPEHVKDRITAKYLRMCLEEIGRLERLLWCECEGCGMETDFGSDYAVHYCETCWNALSQSVPVANEEPHDD